MTSRTASARPRVAVVHDYLTQRGGAERVALAVVRALPGARVVTGCYEPTATFPEFAGLDVETTWLNRVHPLRRDPRKALPLLALAFGGTEVTDVDAVVCSTSGWAHGVSTRAPKIVYCHNPARWLYQPSDYFRRLPRPLLTVIAFLLSGLRRWDKKRAGEASVYLANSTAVQARVREHYGIEATVVHPPAGLLPDGPVAPIVGLAPGFLLVVGRARGYKNTALVAEAVERTPGERLVVVGDLPKRAGGWSDRIVGFRDVSDAELRWLYENAAAVVAVANEDFGLTPVEAFGFGTPVIALREGGYLDSCRAGLTGVWIDEATVHGVVRAIGDFRARSFDSAAIRHHARRWSPERFAADIQAVVGQVLATRRGDDHVVTLPEPGFAQRAS